MITAAFITLLNCALNLAGAVNVTQYHNNATRDGLFVEPAFTQKAAAGLRRDEGFDGRISGSVYAQPLYLENGPGGRPIVIVATESNNVYALDAANGTVVWQRNVGIPVPLSAQLCGNIDPLGITGTPIVDLATRSLLFDALTTPDGGATATHLIYSLNVDTGNTNSGWPVDLSAIPAIPGTLFDSMVENQRGALGIVLGTLYVPYGGHYGDCGIYHGWLVGVPLGDPQSAQAWVTPAQGGGIWAIGGVASDGAAAFIATGNTFGASAWGGGNAIVRLQPGPVFSGAATDFWSPTNWPALDAGDLDLGGSGPLLVDVPDATPSRLVVALGKDGNAYLLDRDNLGGVGAPLSQAHISSDKLIQAAATYRTTQGTYIVVRTGIQLSVFRITPTSPPTLINAWSADQGGYGSPFITSTDGTNDVLVWGLGAGRDQQLHAFDGDTGAVVYSGGGAAEIMSGTRRLSTAIAANGRIYVAADNLLYAFTVFGPPEIVTEPISPTATVSGNASFGAAAVGAGPLSYQWFFDMSPLSGETNTTLLLTNVQPAQAGQYALLVSNAFGSVTSAVAVLSVLLPPVASELIPGTTTIFFKIESLGSLNYILEYKDTLNTGTWTPVPPAEPGSGGVLVLQDTNAVGASRFYRIRAY
ncbi:MAG TPA: hypothetical protein VFE51_00280 [Verrucomicrobiae bacterium]|nr:hypothetical protein [Verrucomicrobiae bacterium]